MTKRSTAFSLGKPIEHVEQAVVATGVKDEFLRFCAVGKQLSYAGYLSYDALIYVNEPTLQYSEDRGDCRQRSDEGEQLTYFSNSDLFL